MQHAVNFICFSFPKALQLPSSEGGISETEKLSHNGEAEGEEAGGRICGKDPGDSMATDFLCVT